MARSDPQLNFRCPEALKKRLEEAAEVAGRSLTAEIVHRLEGTFSPQRELFAPAELEKLLRRVINEERAPKKPRKR